MLESTPVLCMSVILRPRKYFPFNVNRKNTFLKRRVKTKKRKKKIKSKYRSRKNMQSTSQDIKWKSIIRVYRLTDNHENFSLSLPSKSILQVFRSTSVQSSAIEDFQVAAMFSLYRAMSGTRSHRLPFLSLFVSFVLFSSGQLHGCSTFCKSSDISTGVRSTFNLAPVNENSNFIIAGLSGQGQWRSIMGVVLRAQYYTTTLAFRHRA